MVDYTKILMPEIWAESGDIVAPDSQKIKDGWAVEAVPRQWWNWMQNRVDNNVAYMLQKGIPEWDANSQYIANKSYVQRTGIVYKAILTNTNQDPVSATTYWVKAFPESTAALEALRNLTPAADTLPYFTSPTAATTTAITAFARTLLDDPDAATMRSTLSAQIAHANLTGLSGVAAGSNLLPYFTNVDGTMATTSITAYARSILDDADATAARATLGLGTVATCDITTSAYDATAKRILKVGDFGIGATDLIDTSADLDTIFVSGFYCVNGANRPSDSGSNGLLTVITNASNYTIQQFTAQGTSRVWWRGSSAGVFTPWVEAHNTSNGASTAEAKAGTDDTKWMSPLKAMQSQQQFGLGSKLLTTDALITDLQPAIGARASGIYAYNAATTNKPTSGVGVAIYFERIGSAASTQGAWVLAMADDGATYTSRRNNVTGVWSAWTAFSSAAVSVAKAGDTMTGNLKFAGGASGIVADTTNGADNRVISLGGGGDFSITRGAVVNLYGNEQSLAPGRLDLYAGEAGSINLFTGASGQQRLSIPAHGRILVNAPTDDGISQLQVAGQARVSGQIVTNSGGIVGSGASTLTLLNDTTNKLTAVYGGGASSTGGFIEAYGSTHSVAPGELRIGGAMAASGGSLIRFYTQQTQRGIWLANGNLLIGTGIDVGPRLQVSGIAYASQDIVAAGSLFAGGPFGNSPTVVGPNTISIKATDPTNTGNVNLWFYNNNGTERGLIYWSNDGSCHFRTGGSGEMMAINSAGLLTAQNLKSNGNITCGGATYYTDGNVNGTIWGGYLSIYLDNTFVKYGNIQQTIANGSTVGAIGAYTSAQNNSGATLGQGQLVAGTQLKYSSHNSAGNFINVGTWRCMGECNNGGIATFLRVS